MLRIRISKHSIITSSVIKIFNLAIIYFASLHLGLLQDSMLGIASIEQAVEPMPQISKGKISELTKDLKYSIMKVLENYEKGQQDLIEKHLETEVIPIFKNWKQEVENTLKPYILS